MRLSDKAERYYIQACGEKTREIERWFKPELEQVQRINARMGVVSSGVQNREIANVIIERWRRLVQARIDSLIEACEQYQIKIEKDDVDAFIDKLKSSHNLILHSIVHHSGGSGISLHSADELEQIDREARQILLFEVTKAELKRKKTKEEKKMSRGKRTVVKAGNINALQIDGKHNTQNVAINVNQSFDDAVVKLLEHIVSSSLDDLDRDDAIEALERLPRLALKKDSPGVLERAKERLDELVRIIGLSADLYTIGPPLLTILYRYFSLQPPF